MVSNIATLRSVGNPSEVLEGMEGEEEVTGVVWGWGCECKWGVILGSGCLPLYICIFSCMIVCVVCAASVCLAVCDWSSTVGSIHTHIGSCWTSRVCVCV